MNKTIIKIVFIASAIFTFNACSTPEERATVVKGADSASITTSSSTDSLNSAAGRMNGAMDSGQNKSNGDSSANTKMESFRHTPIDTITSISDSTKH